MEGGFMEYRSGSREMNPTPPLPVLPVYAPGSASMEGGFMEYRWVSGDKFHLPTIVLDGNMGEKARKS